MSRFGPKQSLNYSAMICSLVIRITERIPFIKDLVKRLTSDLRFKVDCGFLISDEISSEASYSRMISLISESDALEIVQKRLLLQAISEGFVSDETIAIDATHVEAHDRAPFKSDKAEIEVNLPLYEKKIKDQLDASLTELRSTVPTEPKWGIKKNSEGKTYFFMDLNVIWRLEHTANTFFNRCFLLVILMMEKLRFPY